MNVVIRDKCVSKVRKGKLQNELVRRDASLGKLLKNFRHTKRPEVYLCKSFIKATN